VNPSLSEELAHNGFAIAPAALPLRHIDEIATRLESSEIDDPGSRTALDQDWCRRLAASLRSLPELSGVLGNRVAVQCTYFDKRTDSNWLVPIHQDLSIPVKQYVEAVTLTGWTRKQGRIFVQAPVNVLEEMIAMRLHLDDSDHGNGPLRVVAGSHRFGRIPSRDCARHRDEHGEVECVVPRGGVLLMKPLLLHASSKAVTSRRRRVLHFVFGPHDLPHGLAWAQAA
jgi:ectoine hydroxylase-related dioxygenase (phytanoyl-CoA dioxygenase family)